MSSQYDLKLKTKVKSLNFETVGEVAQVEITKDNRRYQELFSEQNICLSYHILDSNNNVLVNDGIHTSLTSIPTRGAGIETVGLFVLTKSGKYTL